MVTNYRMADVTVAELKLLETVLLALLEGERPERIGTVWCE